MCEINIKEINRLRNIVRNQEYNVLNTLLKFSTTANPELFEKIFESNYVYFWKMFSSYCGFDVIRFWRGLDEDQKIIFSDYLHNKF